MIDVRLQQSFWLSEFLRSDTATRLGIDNAPGAEEMLNIEHVLAPGMQRVRNLLAAPVHITSGFRCLELNRALKSKDNSQHVQGLAADFICPEFGTPLTIARYLVEHGNGALHFDQLIMEGTWVHISFVQVNARAEVLTAHFVDGTATYTKGLS